MSALRLLCVLAGGTLFGLGLAVSTMVQPEVVLSFLLLKDLGLLAVLGSAVLTTLVAYQLAPRVLSRPLLGGAFQTGNWPLLVALAGLFAGAWLQGRFFAGR